MIGTNTSPEESTQTMGILQFDLEISHKDSKSCKKTIEEATTDNEQDKVCPILLAEVLPPCEVL
jgi:hypothetical protein